MSRLNNFLLNPLGLLAFVIIVVAAIVSVASGVVYLTMPEDSEETYVTSIVSLDRDITVSGKFILGIGQINSAPSYFFYREIEPSKFKIGWVSSPNVVIVEENRSDGQLLTVKETKDGVTSYRYEFHVPKNTVIRSFEA